MAEINPYTPPIACDPVEDEIESEPLVLWHWSGVTARFSISALVLYVIWFGDGYGFAGRAHYFWHSFGFLGYYIYERSNGVVQAGFRWPQLAASLTVSAIMVAFAFPAVRSVSMWWRFRRIG